MNLQDFATLELAQAYTETGTKMISPDVMVSYLTTFNSIASVMQATTNEAIGLQAALNFGSEFNLITGHALSVEAMLDKLIVDGIVSEELKTALLAYANPITTPFAESTQADFDSATLTGTLAEDNTTYPNLLEYIELPRNKKVRIYVKTLSIAPANMNVKLYVHACPEASDTSDESNFVKDPNILSTFKVTAGGFGENQTITQTMPTNFKISGESDKAIPFEIIVEQV